MTHFWKGPKSGKPTFGADPWRRISGEVVVPATAPADKQAANLVVAPTAESAPVPAKVDADLPADTAVHVADGVAGFPQVLFVPDVAAFWESYERPPSYIKLRAAGSSQIG